MNGFLRTLLCLSASGTLMALLLFIAKPFAAKRLSKRFWYYLWVPVLLRLCLPLGGIVTMHFPVHEESTVVNQYAVAAPDAQREIQTTPSVTFDDMPNQAQENDALTQRSAAQPTIGLQTSAASTETQPEASETMGVRLLALASNPQTWCVFWALGAAAVAAYHLIVYIRFVRAVKRSSVPATAEQQTVLRALCSGKKTPGLLLCPLVSTPMLLGLFRPKIVLMAGSYQREELENILRHELSHYQRHDLLYKWAALAVNAVHWFNPIVWLVRREINQSCELACDEAVICKMDEKARRSYGVTLLNMATTRRLPTGIVATTMAVNPIKERIVTIMKYQKMTALTLMIAVLLSAALVGCGVVFGANETETESGSAVIEENSAQTNSQALAEDALWKEENFLYMETDAVDTLYDLAANGYSMRIPQLQGDSEDIQRINREIAEKYRAEEWEQDPHESYDYFVTGGTKIISLVICTSYANDVFDFDVYNIDRDGHQLSNRELLKLAGVDEADYLAQETQNVIELHDALYSAHVTANGGNWEAVQTDEAYELSRNVTKELVSIDDAMFMNGDNGLAIVAEIGSQAGAPSYNYLHDFGGANYISGASVWSMVMEMREG